MTGEKDTGVEIMHDLCYVNFSQAVRTGTRSRGIEKNMDKEKPVTLENTTKKFGSETKEREREATGRNGVTLGKENTCTHL